MFFKRYLDVFQKMSGRFSKDVGRFLITKGREEPSVPHDLFYVFLFLYNNRNNVIVIFPFARA